MIRGRIFPSTVGVGLVVLFAWIANNTYWDRVDVPMPLRGEAATNPFYAAQHLAESLGAHTQWRHMLGGPPPRDGVVVASSWHWTLIPARREILERWATSGGRLVIDDSLIGGEAEFDRWTGVVRSNAERSSSRTLIRAAEPKCTSLSAQSEESFTGSSRSRYSLCDLNITSRLTTSRRLSWVLRDDDDHIQALRVPIGRGSVTLINAQPFGNRELFNGDHALLFAAATQLRRADEVYFLSDERGPSLLSLLWSEGAPVVVLALCLVALWLWRSSARFGPLAAEPDPARRSLAEQIRGTGQFTVRFGGGQALHAAAVRSLRDVADRHIAHHARLRGEERIAALARLTGLDPGELAEAINYSGPRRAGELARAIGLLEAARRAICSTAIANAATSDTAISNTKKIREGS